MRALQRHLGYPSVPRLEPPDALPQLLPQLARRLERMEHRVKLLEEEQRGGFDLTKFYVGNRTPSARTEGRTHLEGGRHSE